MCDTWATQRACDLYIHTLILSGLADVQRKSWTYPMTSWARRAGRSKWQMANGEWPRAANKTWPADWWLWLLAIIYHRYQASRTYCPCCCRCRCLAFVNGSEKNSRPAATDDAHSVEKCAQKCHKSRAGAASRRVRQKGLCRGRKLIATNNKN